MGCVCVRVSGDTMGKGHGRGEIQGNGRKQWSCGALLSNLGKRTSWGQCWEGLAGMEVEQGMGPRSLARHGKRRRPQREGGAAWPYHVPCTQCPSCPQCATHNLCHPEELVLLGHSLGISQAPLSSCSSQALQLVSVLRVRVRV